MNSLSLFQRRILATFIAIFIGFLYYLQGIFTGFYIPCMFHAITGLQCPGCGITTAILSLLGGDLQGAVYANFGLTLLLPILIPLLVSIWARWALGKPYYGKITQVLSWACVGVLLLWGIYRNIPTVLGFLQLTFS